jgi:hypothetical protein
MTDHNEDVRAGDPDGLETRLDRLTETADELCSRDEHRREPLVEWGEERGLRRELAEHAYDIAHEEQLPPAYGVAVAAAGISVAALESPAPDVGATEAGQPEWVDRPPGPRAAEVERRLRQTLRRLRSLLPASSTPADAIAALAREPDLEPFDY